MENPKIKITPDIIKQSKTLTCDCGGMLFQNGAVFKKLSALISPSGKEEMVPLDVLVCTKCGKVPTEFNVGNILPDEVLAKKQTTIK
jgi:hypothetical protein